MYAFVAKQIETMLRQGQRTEGREQGRESRENGNQIDRFLVK